MVNIQILKIIVFYITLTFKKEIIVKFFATPWNSEIGVLKIVNKLSLLVINNIYKEFEQKLVIEHFEYKEQIP